MARLRDSLGLFNGFLLMMCLFMHSWMQDSIKKANRILSNSTNTGQRLVIIRSFSGKMLLKQQDCSERQNLLYNETDLITIRGTLYHNVSSILMKEGGEFEGIIKQLQRVLVDISLDEIDTMENKTVGYEALFEAFHDSSVVEVLWSRYQEQQPRLAQDLSPSSVFPCHQKQIKTIAIFSHRFYHGGIERVISLRIKDYLRLGLHVVYFTHTIKPSLEFPIDPSVIRRTLPPTPGINRIRTLHHYLHKFHVDLLIHEQPTNAAILFDLLCAKCQGISCVLIKHTTIFESLRGHDPNVSTAHLTYALADRFYVLSKMEVMYYQIMGVHAEYLPNPVESQSVFPVKSLSSKQILWVGRLDHFKNYLDPLKIMSQVLRSEEKASLIMLGSEYDYKSSEKVREFIEKNQLQNRVHWYGNVADVESWYDNSTLLLMTSDFESFPMVAIEAKVHALPIIMYSLPYVELFKNNTGIISVDPDDIGSAADTIVRVLQNSTLYQILSYEAQQSIIPFQTINHSFIWKDIIDHLERCKSQHIQPVFDQTLIRTLLQTIIFQFTKSVRLKGE